MLVARKSIKHKALTVIGIALSLSVFGQACRQRGEHNAKDSLKVAATSSLHTLKSFTLPVKEASGLCSFEDPQTKEKYVLAINDSDKKVIFSELSSLKSESLKNREINFNALKSFSGNVSSSEDDSQWEAIFADASGLVYISNEEEGVLDIFDVRKNKHYGRIELKIKNDDKEFSDLKKAWDKDSGSRIEGFVMMSNHHILAVKEKNPPVLIEFVPEGEQALGVESRYLRQATLGAGQFKVDSWPGGTSEPRWTYVAKKIWRPASEFSQELDLSELTVTPSGQLAILSDRLGAVFIVSPNLSLGETTFKALKTFKLPDEIEKPEGLIFLSDSEFLVVSDLKEIKPNLFRVRIDR